jgi:hypothetical protein
MTKLISISPFIFPTQLRWLGRSESADRPRRFPLQERSIPCNYFNHRFNMEVDLQSLFGLHVTCDVHSCTHWLRPRTPPPPPHPPPNQLGLVYEGAIDKQRKTKSRCDLLISVFLLVGQGMCWGDKGHVIHNSSSCWWVRVRGKQLLSYWETPLVIDFENDFLYGIYSSYWWGNATWYAFIVLIGGIGCRVTKSRIPLLMNEKWSEVCWSKA